MKRLERIAYRGDAFTIEWYYDEAGQSPALEYFNGSSEDHQDDALLLFRRMGDSGKIFDTTKFRSEGDKIFAFKPSPYRYLCFFFAGRKIIVTNAYLKKSQKLPPSEKARALKAKVDYESRVRKGTYYAKEEK